MQKESVVKTPVELQLQKINTNNLLQFKNIEIQYHLLRLLHSILISEGELVSTASYFRVFNQMLNFQEVESVRMLPLFQKYSYLLWNQQNFSIDIRQKTNFYSIISNWIVNFQLRTGKLDTINNQFQLIIDFMQKETRTVLEKLVMMEEIFQDLKELIDPEFWNEEEQIKVEASSFGKFKNQLPSIEDREKEENCSPKDISTIQTMFQLVEAVMTPLYYRVTPKNTLHKNCTYGQLSFPNVETFIKKCIYYALKVRGMPVHMQTQLTRIALAYLQFLNQQQADEILNMIRHLMLRTSKAVRFALVVQYVQFYEYLEMMGHQEVIEELENMVYFRQLIIGKKIVEESIMEIGNHINDTSLSYNSLYIKAGTSKRVYFSNQHQDCVLKLDVFVDQNDINMKICLLDNIAIDNKSTNLKQFVFQTVASINSYEGSQLKPDKIYWKEERSTSKKLELKLQYQGLYWLQFDNSYSWVIPKNIKYRLQLYQPLK